MKLIPESTINNWEYRDYKLPTVLPEFHKFRLQDDNIVNIITLKWEHYNDDKAFLDLSKLA